ncbi:uncharacterized protein BCR38DRAFT_458553 [Pseudomassariella vexata]|uniref:Uncharacterized protein n=1 Tax=Pseudomassariella vexata TaxID=1141098 RepID=A0A1Y2DVX0_9PEZI|nr:uncharacterized protein BCR38DRAFT_458553 [Pseudomassariella vexata]ORY63413.1 hypothetical protein BCR38DRAFT_458553 [Pseudomassariella vexata]
MDAQNALESISAKQAAASPKWGASEAEHDAKAKTNTNAKSPVSSKAAPSINDPKPAASASSSSSNLPVPDGDAPIPDRDSDAETIVLYGKDGISPSKPRKMIKHEDKSEGEVDDVPAVPRQPGRDGERSGPGAVGAGASGATDDVASSLGKKKRLGLLEKEKQQHQKSKDGSSGLSSAPASPPSHQRNHSSSHRRRRSGGDHRSESDSESSKPRSPKVSKDKLKPLEGRPLSTKRKAPKVESDDESEARKARRPRMSDTSVESKHPRDHKPSSSRPHQDKPSISRTRSISPHGRAHRRSLSTQLPSHNSNGLGHKKRRIPAPLQNTEYHSDDSSASGSPHPRSSRLKSIATPVTGDSNMSPAKMGPHKKHLDAHGQTLFAKACAKGEYDVAKTRLQERPEDLNFADHAGNTPLQVAALNGHEEIVELLIQAGCNLECRNDVKDTPLLDAVENGHLGVVKLLLAAGVNPRKANAIGQEPLELLPDDIDNAEEIRAALVQAKQRIGELRRTSEDHPPQDNHDVSSHGPDSPRRSPPATSGSAAARRAAARGDHETVSRILQVKEGCDDSEALVAAARALGGANPDPSPVKTLPTDHGTPMLAAIGGENIKVIQLLLDQLREGPISSAKTKSPSRRERDHDQEDVSKSHKRRPSSPPRDSEHKKRLEKQRSMSFSNQDDQISPKRGPGRPKKEERVPTIAVSDREASPASSSKTHPMKSKRAESDPRRKLMSAKDLKGQQASDRHDEGLEKARADRISEKYHDRTKALKRDESKDRLVTPPRHGSGDRDDSEAPPKRRRLDAEGKEKRTPQNNPSPDDRPKKRDISRDSKVNRDRRESEKSSPSEKASITVFSQDMDVDMRDTPVAADREEAKKRQAELEAVAAEEVRKKEEVQKREAEEKRQKEEAERKRQEEEERKRREEEERKRKEEEDRERVRLEEQRKQQEEEDRKRREEEQKRREEEERKQREEEERLRREKEAAEHARKIREEEERKDRERKRAAERAAREAEQKRIREEQERLRLAKLPPLLRWFDQCPDPKQKEFAELFTIMQGVRYDTINPLATGRSDGREQWLLNTQVALLLGEKDLTLSRYTAWEQIPVSNIAKTVIWRLEQDRYALTEGKLYHLGEQLPDYYGGDPNKVGYRKLEQLRGEASKLFFEMDMFFVKESDFLYILPHFSHLRNVRLAISYRELPEHEGQLATWCAPAKWKQDPDAESREGFAPRQKYYINGQFISEDKPGHYKPSKSPFPEQRVPRRGGIVAVAPEEPEYPRLCMEQGLSHLLSDQQKLSVMNGAHLTPRSMTSNDTAEAINGENLSPTAASPTIQVNGYHGPVGPSEKPQVNGINGDH